MRYLPKLDSWIVSNSNVSLTEVKNSGWKGHYYKITSPEEYLNHYSVKDTLKQKSDGKLRKVDTIKEIEIFYSDKTGLFHLFNGKTLIGDFVLDPVNILGVNVNQISRIEIIPIFRGNKYAQVVYDFVIKHFGVIASSSEQTKDARKIWENMYEQGKYYILLYDTVKHTLENVKNENGLTGLVNPSSGKYKIYIACKKIPNPFLNLLNESFKFTPRRIQNRKEEKTKKIERLLQQTHIEGDLDLRGTKITSLGNIKSVEGSLNLNDCTNLTSLGNLEYVGRFLYLENCTNLSSLGNIKSVGGFLYLIGTNITYIDPSIIIKGQIWKRKNWFSTIQSFNEYFQNKQNLKEEFKFQPRRINDRKILFSDIKSKYLDYLKQNTFTDKGIYNTLKELGVKRVLKQNVYSYFINSEGKKVFKKGFKTIYIEKETGVRIHSQYLKQIFISTIEKMPDIVFLNFWNKRNGAKYVFSDDRNYVIAKV